MSLSSTPSSSNTTPSPLQKLSSTSSSSPVIVPTPTSTEESEPGDNVLMESEESSKAVTAAEAANSLQTKQGTPPSALEAGDKDAKASLVADTKKKAKSEKTVDKSKRAVAKKRKQKVESEDEESSDEESESEESSSEDEQARRKRKKKAAAAVAKKKAAEKKAAKLKAREKAKAKKRKTKKLDSSDESSSSDSDSESESEDERVKRKKKAKAKKKKIAKYASSSEESSSSSSSSSSESDSEDEKEKRKRTKKKAKNVKKSKTVESDSSSSLESETEAEETLATTAEASTSAEVAAAQEAKIKAAEAALAALQLQQQQLQQQQLATATATAKTTKVDEKKAAAKKSSLEFKRVDQVWDTKARDWKYTESVEEQKDEFDSVFTVRRRFGWDNKYIETQVDIKSKLLRNVLQIIFKDCKSISLVEDKPSIQPHMLFHYYDEIKAHVKKVLKPELKRAKKRKAIKQLKQQISQCSLLLRYIDEDYEETRKTLKPMLKAGTITYNLVWALFKPNTVAYTPTYGNKDDPRCFKVDLAWEEEDWFGNKKWNIEGRYLEYDGKVFGLGDHFVQIPAFKGPKKIANLAAYPLEFHKDPETLRELLIERGKKFVALQGMNYRFHNGLGYMKIKRIVAKFNINGRVMIDPAIFRRINPNYPLSYIKQDELGQEESDDDESDDGCGCDSDSENESGDEKQKTRVVMWKDKQGKKHLIRIPPGEKGPDITSQKLDSVEDEGDDVKHIFTEDELLIASPVVLGFSFSEKAWLEFSLSGIKDIEWNDEAFDTLVLEKRVKQNLKGLVSSHRFNAAKTIDDVIVGKGKGLNVVLHGPPGVGKTLTGESIAEYLRCPLYAVSSGELGTSAAQLERDLNRIMDITHSWGAILLLDEADVFLEARQPHDIHRNALVSVFLRLTEYYQGILFLTTNRVATFDEAFQSRIHMGIRYEELPTKARKKIWMHHVGKVLKMAEGKEGGEQKPKEFTESDFDELSKKVMNGRQIKNAVKTSQSIAVSEKGVFSMEYIKRVMEVHESFEEDMRGGCGYRDAMRQYT